MADITNMLLDFRRSRPSFEKPEELRHLIEALIYRYYLEDASSELIRRLFDSIFADGTAPNMREALSRNDAMYLSNILALRVHIKNRRFCEDSGSRISTATQETDFLVENIDEWPLLKFVNFALLQAILPTRRAAVVTSIRNEGVSILEWVAHYKSLGFDEIFVYTNGNTDGSNILLERLASDNVIRLIQNTVSSTVAPQIKAYEHSLHFLPELRQYRWVFYIDADEFFVPRCGANLNLDDFFKELESKFHDKPPAAISFNWKWFGSENAFERTDGLLLERFVHSIHNEHVKTLAQLNCILSMRPLHCPVLFKDCLTVNSKFEELAPTTTQVKPVYGAGQINHYWNKSFQEFVIKKFRGRGAVASTESQRDFSMFFDWGANDRRGNFDPPPSVVLERTQAAYDKLLELPGVSSDLISINESMNSSIAEIDTKLNLRRIYENRGRTNSA